MDRRRDDARDFNGAGRALAHDARWLPQSLPRRARADLLDRRIERCARPNGGCDSVTEGCGQQQRIGTASGLGDGALIDSVRRTRTQTVTFINLLGRQTLVVISMQCKAFIFIRARNQWERAGTQLARALAPRIRPALPRAAATGCAAHPPPHPSAWAHTAASRVAKQHSQPEREERTVGISYQ